MRFGFTASEAEELASRRGLPPCRLPQMCDWYDGYCFGGTDVRQLYLAGYVTTDDVAVPNDAMRERRLRVPNREVAHLFRGEFVERSVREHGRGRPRRFREALLGLDADGMGRALDAVLDESPSCPDLTSENSHHMLLLGLLYGPWYGRRAVSLRAWSCVPGCQEPK